MNYRHAFHAGNFGDVLKHVVLVAILERLTQKDKPLFFLDTHAGRGRYELDSGQALKSGEAASGIAEIALQHGLPPLVQRYLALVRRCNPAGSSAVRIYPGSPLLAAELMRPTDRAALCELQPGEAGVLRQTFRADPRMAVHVRDGYEALRAMLPPPERRGLVLVDPPYELQERELIVVAGALAAAQRRWPQGVIAAWYPIKRLAGIEAFHAALVARGISKLLIAELCIRTPDNDVALNGAGMVLINPPWKLDTELEATLPGLHKVLSHSGRGGTRVKWLVPEAPAGSRDSGNRTIR